VGWRQSQQRQQQPVLLARNPDFAPLGIAQHERAEQYESERDRGIPVAESCTCSAGFLLADSAGHFLPFMLFLQASAKAFYALQLGSPLDARNHGRLQVSGDYHVD
jgi:hypothetical protein